MNYYVYIMTNAHRTTLYTGVTNNLPRRVFEHKNHLDKGSFTDQYNCEFLVYYEVTTNVESAIAREKQIKGWVKRKKIALFEKINPNWDDLYQHILQ